MAHRIRAPVCNGKPPQVTAGHLGFWLKYDRANEHLALLRTYLDETFAAPANRVYLGTRSHTLEPGRRYRHEVYVSAAPDLTRELARVSVLLGDAVHGYRSALDHLAFELATRNSGTLTEREARTVQFPICRTPFDWLKTAAEQLRLVAPAARGIIESFQPYQPPKPGITITLPGGTFEPLLALQEISNTDKHRVLTATLSDAMGFSSDELSFTALLGIMGGSLYGNSVPPGTAAQVGLVISTFEATGDPLPNQASAWSVVPDVSLRTGTPARPAVERIAEVVSDILSAFFPRDAAVVT